MSDAYLGAVLKFVLSAGFVGLVASLIIIACKNIIENLINGIIYYYKKIKNKVKKSIDKGNK